MLNCSCDWIQNQFVVSEYRNTYSHSKSVCTYYYILCKTETVLWIIYIIPGSFTEQGQAETFVMLLKTILPNLPELSPLSGSYSIHHLTSVDRISIFFTFSTGLPFLVTKLTGSFDTIAEFSNSILSHSSLTLRCAFC